MKDLRGKSSTATRNFLAAIVLSVNLQGATGYTVARVFPVRPKGSFPTVLRLDPSRGGVKKKRKKETSRGAPESGKRDFRNIRECSPPRTGLHATSILNELDERPTARQKRRRLRNIAVRDSAGRPAEAGSAADSRFYNRSYGLS